MTDPTKSSAQCSKAAREFIGIASGSFSIGEFDCLGIVELLSFGDMEMIDRHVRNTSDDHTLIKCGPSIGE
jgi:hypothetical protein